MTRADSELVVFMGARPNAPKAWTLFRGIRKARPGSLGSPVLVHTNQHYDDALGASYAAALGLEIDFNLAVTPTDTDGAHLAQLMGRIATFLDKRRVSSVVAIGDVNTAVAAAIVSARLDVPVIHLEAGLRSHSDDPEELNRRIITACTTYHLAPSQLAVDNLRTERIDERRIFLVGNTMAEAFICHADRRHESDILRRLGVKPSEYVLVTLHKPATLAQPNWILDLLTTVARDFNVVFPLHPHTAKVLARDLGQVPAIPRLQVVDPLNYVDFSALLVNCLTVVSDSAGVQEEATIAMVPCLGVGPRTARPETVSFGTNRAVAFDIELCMAHLRNPSAPLGSPSGWDDAVSDRIAHAFDLIQDELATKQRRWRIR